MDQVVMAWNLKSSNTRNETIKSKESTCSCEPKTKPAIEHMPSKNDHIVDWLFPKRSHWLLVFSQVNQQGKREINVTETISIPEESCNTVQTDHKAWSTSCSMWLPYVDAGHFQRRACVWQLREQKDFKDPVWDQSFKDFYLWLIWVFKYKRPKLCELSPCHQWQPYSRQWVLTGSSGSHQEGVLCHQNATWARSSL